MRADYPKEAIVLRVQQTRKYPETAEKSARQDTCETTINLLINEYVQRLGSDSDIVLNLVTNLLTQGKINVDFPDYIERLEVIDLEFRLTKPQAVTLLDDYIAALNINNVEPASNVTQRISIPIKPRTATQHITPPGKPHTQRISVPLQIRSATPKPPDKP